LGFFSSILKRARIARRKQTRKEEEMEQAQDFIKSGKVGRVATITIDHPTTNSINTGILKQKTQQRNCKSWAAPTQF
jgi:hypothetical protein